MTQDPPDPVGLPHPRVVLQQLHPGNVDWGGEGDLYEWRGVLGVIQAGQPHGVGAAVKGELAGEANHLEFKLCLVELCDRRELFHVR